MSRLRLLTDLFATLSERSLSLIGATGQGRATPGGLIGRCEGLLSSRGEASGVAMASDILAGVTRFGDADLVDWLRQIAARFDPDPATVLAAAEAYAAEPSPAAAQRLAEAAEPRRRELFRRLNLAPGGTLALVRLRARLLGLLADHPDLGAVDGDLQHLFASWFNRGFLVLRPIDWSTPASLLEKIIAYEAVHEISGWDDLRRRLQPPDRRCFAFFHPALGDEPLIFVEVALTPAMPARIGDLLAPDRPVEPAEAQTVATFYSISNCQAGLRGVSFGNFLIKQVAVDLKADLPRLKSFVTLSPVPGLMGWARGHDDPAVARLVESLDGEPGWHLDGDGEVRREAVMRLAARYLLEAKGRSGQAADPVARFHLGNGASLERINWLGDVSAKGLAQSAGIMVNYLYDLARVEANHEAYSETGKVAASRQVRALAGA